jgi:predicted metal-dependent hydrolase
MPDSQTINIDGVGPVLFDRTSRTHRVLITVRPTTGVRVAVPYSTSMNFALDFVNRKKAWIQKHLANLQLYEKQKQAADEFILSINKKEARKKIIGRLAELAKQHGFTYGKVSIRNQRTRWGSCSGRNNISFNIKLLALPPELADYVILHELVHTRIHDHSLKFWTELDKYVGNGKALKRRMIEYGLRLL